MIKPIEININFQFIDSLVLHSPMRSLDDTLNVTRSVINKVVRVAPKSVKSIPG